MFLFTSCTAGKEEEREREREREREKDCKVIFSKTKLRFLAKNISKKFKGAEIYRMRPPRGNM